MAVKIQNIYKLSPMQASILFHWLANKESAVYFDHKIFFLKGEIDSSILKKSFDILIERFEILRTIFRYEDFAALVQVVLKHRSINIHEENISHLPEKEKQAYLEKFLKADKEKGFDLSKDLLTRITLFKTGVDQYRMVWSSHHILMDGWCREIVFKDLIDIYRHLKEGKSPDLEPTVPYSRAFAGSCRPNHSM